MTIKLYGAAGPGATPGTMTEYERARYHELIAGSLERTTGFAASVGAGTRQIVLAPGEIAVGGLLGESDANVTVTLDAQTGTQGRVDTICFQSLLGSGPDGGSIVVVKGTPGANPVAATLVRDWNASPRKWQTALYRVPVAPGAVAFTLAQLESVRPGPRRTLVLPSTPIEAVSFSQAGTRVVATATADDPGWPYKLAVDAVVTFAALDLGRAFISCLVDEDQVGVDGRTASGAGAAVLPPVITAARTGPIKVRIRAAHGENTTGPLVTEPSLSRLRVQVIPA